MLEHANNSIPSHNTTTSGCGCQYLEEPIVIQFQSKRKGIFSHESLYRLPGIHIISGPRVTNSTMNDQDNQHEDVIARDTPQHLITGNQLKQSTASANLIICPINSFQGYLIPTIYWNCHSSHKHLSDSTTYQKALWNLLLTRYDFQQGIKIINSRLKTAIVSRNFSMAVEKVTLHRRTL